MSGYNEQFLKKNPLAILGVLRDLNKNQVPLRISWAHGQFISKILAVDPEKLIVDYGSQEYENSAVLRAGQVAIIAETQGAKVEFTLPQLVTGEYQRLPAFITPLPSSLWFVQRREYFRIGALLESAIPDGLIEGARFSQVELNMGPWGILHVDAQLIAISERKVIDGKNETITTPRLSFRFLNVSPAVERELQRIIFSLEREARERANKVRE
ncbi:flagellar brake protein [Salmonella enterica]|nr:flagellar brake protein [Salmonella enterica]EFT3758579.1 flagellar brake protein [Salmonella enterica]EIB4817246.1 flagellar brake protein [Salmonella enterica]EMB7630631.1 flagellar brake protein [Salmonella enterica]